MAADNPDTTNQPEEPETAVQFTGALPEKRKKKPAGSADLVGLNIRLTKDMWKALKFAAQVEDKPQAELVREWIAPELEEYAMMLGMYAQRQEPEKGQAEAPKE